MPQVGIDPSVEYVLSEGDAVGVLVGCLDRVAEHEGIRARTSGGRAGSVLAMSATELMGK